MSNSTNDLAVMLGSGGETSKHEQTIGPAVSSGRILRRACRRRTAGDRMTLHYGCKRHPLERWQRPPVLAPAGQLPTTAVLRSLVVGSCTRWRKASGMTVAQLVGMRCQDPPCSVVVQSKRRCFASVANAQSYRRMQKFRPKLCGTGQNWGTTRRRTLTLSEDLKGPRYSQRRAVQI